MRLQNVYFEKSQKTVEVQKGFPKYDAIFRCVAPSSGLKSGRVLLCNIQGILQTHGCPQSCANLPQRLVQRKIANPPDGTLK